MKFALRRRILVTAPALTLILAGCVSEQTQEPYNPTNGANSDAGDILVRNVVVVTDDSGTATVLASFTNTGNTDDRLVEVIVDDVTAIPSEPSIDLPAGDYASIGPDDIRVDVTGSTATAGHMVDVEFRFSKGPRVEVETLVQADEGVYADVEVTEATATAQS